MLIPVLAFSWRSCAYTYADDIIKTTWDQIMIYLLYFTNFVIIKIKYFQISMEVHMGNKIISHDSDITDEIRAGIHAPGDRQPGRGFTRTYSSISARIHSPGPHWLVDHR